MDTAWLETQGVDVTQMAADAGFTCSVYLNREVWDKCVVWNSSDSERQVYQEEDARLWDVLFVPAFKLKSGLGTVTPGRGMPYEIYCLLRDKEAQKTEVELIQLRAVPIDTDNGPAVIITF